MAATGREINAVELGADATGKGDSWAALQQAVDLLTTTGGTLYLPAGRYRIERTLQWRNGTQRRAPGILFRGDGAHSTVLQSHVKDGPLIRVRGIPERLPFSTTFFWGGGIQDMTLDGNRGGDAHDAIETLGWWYGEIARCQITGFSRHAIRATTDTALVANPDYSASTLYVRSTWIERCGGYGFIDDSDLQGAPAWSWDHVVFVLCRSGGALVRSSSHGFVKCSFSACGWRAEDAPPASAAYGLFFDGAVTASSRHWVEGCEFDTNLTAHIGIRFLSSSSFINNRFIFNDRYRVGRLCPAAGVELAVGDANAAIRSVEFRQNFFRFDTPGKAAGFVWNHRANVRDIDIARSVFADNTLGKVQLDRYVGMGDTATASAAGYAIDELRRSP